MRGLATAVAVLVLASCQHRGAVAGYEALIEQARRAVAREHIVVDGLVPTVLDRGHMWIVWFQEPAPNVLDGGITVMIDKKTGRVEGIASDA